MKLIVISILTKIIVIRIFAIIEQPYMYVTPLTLAPKTARKNPRGQEKTYLHYDICTTTLVNSA